MKNNIFLLSVISMALWSCKKEMPKQNDGPKPFEVVNAEVKNLTGYSTYPATIQGIVNNDVRAKIQGYITQVLVDEGQFVSKGQPLFKLETNVLSETEDAAKSGIAAALANISAAQAAVNAAQVEVDKLKPLVQKNIISTVQLQTAQANVAKAQAQLMQTKAAHQQSVASYKSAKANVDYSIIRAPISGVIGKLPLKVGSLVGPSDPTALTTISNTSSVYAYFSMNEKEYLNFLEKAKGATVPEKIKNLPMVDLELANGSIYGDKGRIETVSGQIDPSTGTIQFRAGFANAQKLLSNGNSGVIRFPIHYDGAVVIPESATYEQQGIVYAYKVGADNNVKNEIIQVKDRVNNMVIVTSGIVKGDKIVATGIGSLKPDTQIIPKPIHFDSLVQSIKPVF
jgi:membrane fusion protein (multidrug efflux system)